MLWVIVLVAGAALVGGLSACQREPSPDAGAPPIPTEASAPLSGLAPADAFLAFARRPAGGTTDQAGPDYIAEGLRLLAGALDSLDIGDDQLALDLRVAATHVQLRPAAPDVAELVRDLAIRTAEALPPGPAGGGVRPRADAISAGTSLVQQQTALTAFFAAAAAALDRRAETTD